MALAEHCRGLQAISLVDCPQLSEPSLIQLARSCRKLRELIVSRNIVSDSTVVQLQSESKGRLLIRVCPTSFESDDD